MIHKAEVFRYNEENEIEVQWMNREIWNKLWEKDERGVGKKGLAKEWYGMPLIVRIALIAFCVVGIVMALVR